MEGYVNPILSFPELVKRLSREFESIDPDTVAPTSSLFDDLEMDSFEIFRLLIVLEVIADAAQPLDVPDIYTLGDVYRYFVDLAQPPESGSAEIPLRGH